MCTVLIFRIWDFLGCMIIGDGMDTILRLEDTFFSLERETIKKEKKKKKRLPLWFWRNYKVVRLMKKVRGFFRGK